MDDNPPAFPVTTSNTEPGMYLRDWFATFAPRPTRSEIAHEWEHDRLANPHGENHKPPRRSRLEIVVDLRYRYANAMIARRNI